jgi:3-hydroxyisobutyrate dehydrogenase-like beta-hydroxyacid dehydrogenase
MKVGFVGIGEMGFPMAGHAKKAGYDVTVYDIDKTRVASAKDAGFETASSLADLAKKAEIFICVVNTDDQSRQVTDELSKNAARDSIIVISATNSPLTMRELKKLSNGRGVRFIDSPIVFGASGAKAGKLLCLCGGDDEDVERARPVLMTYSKDVLHVGPVGAGQLAKACNNLLHWVHCVSNYETLLLAKRFGIDAQRMREVLLKCPAYNGTLDRWDTTKFTWQEKDMDVTMDLAQTAGLMLPMAGLTDQMVKVLKAKDVAELLYGPECDYMGVHVKPMTPEEGGFD